MLDCYKIWFINALTSQIQSRGKNWDSANVDTLSCFEQTILLIIYRQFCWVRSVLLKLLGFQLHKKWLALSLVPRTYIMFI